ncbi:sulfurtransferase [Winogradskyella sp.]|uniref:sulfurtransferase n=1 Tax=Winogradskyella sp. TaxID=1883156 RepID=UPI003F6AC10F
MSRKVHLQTSVVSVDWLNANSDASNLIVLDCTINKKINNTSQRIPNSRFFDIKQKFSDTSAEFPSMLPSIEQFQNEAQALGINNDSAVVVYDDKGIYSSPRVWWLFKIFGFKNIAVLNGGLPEWLANGFQVEKYSDDVYSYGNFEASFQPELITNFKGIQVYTKRLDTVILDARSRPRFNCFVDEPRAGLRRGTIPNSKNLPYTELLNVNKLKTKKELSEIFNILVKDKTILVFSCGSGITACILALAATQCNFKNLVVYDGSWTEYGTLIK